MAYRRELPDRVTMPLLFKNGKLVINDIDQLVFSDDPDSCRCCPGACECPAGSDFAASGPKYIDDINVALSNFPNTYEESKYEGYLVQYQNGQVVRQIDEAYLTIAGISALNGTYPGELKQAGTATDCTLPDPLPACPYDSQVACEWRVPTASVAINGTLRIRQYRYQRFPNDVETDNDKTYYLTGYATALTTQNGRVLIQCCVRETSYSGTVVGAFTIEANKGFDGQQSELMTYKDRYNTPALSRSGCELEWTSGANFGGSSIYFPSMMVHKTIIDLINNCPYGATTAYSYFPFYACNAVSPNDVSYSLIGCSDSGSTSELVALGTATLTSTWSYSISQFDYDVNWTVSYDPP